MYPPLRDFLVRHGYSVRSEVRGCDVVAEKDGDVIVLEMKRHLSVALLAQAAVRQRSVESVYVVVPHPGKKTRTKEWRQALHLLRRLELGLVLVKFSRVGQPQEVRVAGADDESSAPGASLEVVHHPMPFERKRRRSERAAIIREAHGRSGDYNQGGSTGQTIVTAYRENAVMIACFLALLGPTSPARLRTFGTGPKTLSILSRDFYGWFERVSRGVYGLTLKGLREAQAFEALWNKYTAEAQSATPPEGSPAPSTEPR